MDPFLADLDTVCDDDLVKDDLIELRIIQMLKSDFNSNNVAEFWCSLKQAYPRQAKKATIVLILFLQSTSVKRDFRLFLLSKQNNKIGWMLRTTCVLLGRKPFHSFVF